MINVNETMTGNDGFVQTDNIVFRLYPLLEGFTVETAGLYSYLKSWRYNSPGPMHHCVWLNRAEMYAQTGLGRRKFDGHIQTLGKYGLVTVEKSKQRANKDIFRVGEPLTEGEFRALYPAEIAAFAAELDAIYAVNKADEAQFSAKKVAWKAEQVQLAKQPEPPPEPAEPDGWEAIRSWL
ncbi:hypothetical protein [Paenibacillus naphthalenovorans]|uniref:hypothetical protein n=1 Tax=Paenibacillus naphthalenovorans TaxID=162209 RepID=UPI003D282E07